jgi:hypothetical protein
VTPIDEERRLLSAQEIQKRAQRPPVTKPSKYKKGQMVYWRSGLHRNKLEPRLEGPFTIS